MSSIDTGTLFDQPHELARVHRRVVRVGALASWVAAAALLVTGFFSHDPNAYVEAVVPMAAGALMTVQILVGRENGAVAMIGAVVIALGGYSMMPTPENALPLGLTLVVAASLGMLFVDRHFYPVATLVGIGLFAVPWLWVTDPFLAADLGLVMCICFAATSGVLIVVRNAATALDARFRLLFERSPTALLEEDWSGAITLIRSEYTGRPDRLRPFLAAFPDVAREAVNRARVTRVNQATLDLLEVGSADELLGNRFGSRMGNEELDAFIDGLVALFEGQDYFETEFPSHSGTGRLMWLRARCVNHSSGTDPASILVAVDDVSHTRYREEQADELVRAKDDFIASVSHELRTPLTAVLGLASEMSADTFTPDERDEMLRLVVSQAEEMSFVVEDILAAARAEIGSISAQCDPVDLHAEVVATVAGLRLDGLAVPDTMPEVLADASRLRQILRNLLTNLDRYGGTEQRLLCDEVDEVVWLEVRDNGAGVPVLDAERIFQPYTTSHPGSPGSVGLGLSVSRQLARMMGGDLSYRRDGNESVFRLELPSAPAQDQSASSVD
jgi:signal transduction histidine kinase